MIQQRMDTKPLSPFATEKESVYKTYVMNGPHSLRRLLATAAGSLAAGEAAPKQITLTIRGMKETYALSEDQILLIGRADFQARTGFRPDVDLSPYGAHERGVSRAHARLHLHAGKVYVTDLHSANGTFVNRERLQPEQPRQIGDGSEFLLGALPIRLQLG